MQHALYESYRNAATETVRARAIRMIEDEVARANAQAGRLTTEEIRCLFDAMVEK
jgi:hypothetical protein